MLYISHSCDSLFLKMATNTWAIDAKSRRKCHDHAERVMQSWSARFNLRKKRRKEREKGAVIQKSIYRSVTLLESLIGMP